MQEQLFDMDQYLSQAEDESAEALDTEMGGKFSDIMAALNVEPRVAAATLIFSVLESGIPLKDTIRHIRNVADLFTELDT